MSNWYGRGASHGIALFRRSSTLLTYRERSGLSAIMPRLCATTSLIRLGAVSRGMAGRSAGPPPGAARSRAACVAAPSATAWSGWMPPMGGRPDIRSTHSRTMGILVEPPTGSTPSMSAQVSPASLSACPVSWTVRSRRSALAASNSARVTVYLADRVPSLTLGSRRSAAPTARA